MAPAAKPRRKKEKSLKITTQEAAASLTFTLKNEHKKSKDDKLQLLSIFYKSVMVWCDQ